MSSSKMTALVGELYKVTTHFKLYTARLETETGIRQEKSVPYCPEQNGVAERFNWTLFEAARSLFHAKKLPLRLWAEAVVYAVYTLNGTLSSTGKVTPYQI
jgi:transposase InsO family protein